MAKKSADLIPVGADSPYAVLRMDENELRSVIASTVGPGALDASVLDRVKLPTGGGTLWEVPTIDGVEGMGSLDGVVLHMANRRVYWKDAYGEGEAGAPPECSSDDGFTGIGNPGGDCAACPLNAFGTSRNGHGKACSEIKQIFLLPQDSIIPIVINATPGSLKSVQQYTMRLLRAALPTTAVVTKMTLEKSTSKSGQNFSRIVCAAGDRLDPDARARVESLRDSLMPAFLATRVDMSDVEVVD